MGAAAAAWGHPLFVRFAHEMNGNWYPWSEGVNGNRQGDFVRAWRHVHDIVVRAGARNVSWIWSVNRDYTGSTPLAGLYPGDAYVDWDGVDVYNGGTAVAMGGWLTFSQMFDPTYKEIHTFSAKPLLINEMASAEAGGSKAGVDHDFFAALHATRRSAGSAGSTSTRRPTGGSRAPRRPRAPSRPDSPACRSPQPSSDRLTSDPAAPGAHDLRGPVGERAGPDG